MELRPPLHLGVLAIEKGAFESPSTTIANFTLYILYIDYIYTLNIEIHKCSFRTHTYLR